MNFPKYKIILANKYYYARGGDCIYTINLEKILKDYGHEVAVFSMEHPENFSNAYQKYFPAEVIYNGKKNLLRSSIRPFGTPEVKQKFNALLNNFNPDIVHLNNIHTQLSPIIAKIAYERNIPVVWTIHDYKLLCPRYDCLRKGQEPCELCFGNRSNILKYKCMKNSFVASIAAYMEAMVWNRKRLEKYTSAFICPSQFIAEKMETGGFNKNKIIVLNNFIETEKCRTTVTEKEDYYCYIGRLSHEKGVETLVKAAQELPYKLKIIGAGPLTDHLKTITQRPNIEFLGYKNWDEIKEISRKARFLVIPSEWYENNPFSVIESLCLGTPVLGSDIGGIPELINIPKNGMLFDPRNTEDLTSKIKKMFEATFNYQEIAHEALEKFNSDNYYYSLLNIYKSIFH